MKAVQHQEQTTLLEEKKLRPGKKLDGLIAQFVFGAPENSEFAAYPWSTNEDAIFILSREMRIRHNFLFTLEDLSIDKELWQASFSDYFCVNKSPAYATCIAALKALQVV